MKIESNSNTGKQFVFYCENRQTLEMIIFQFFISLWFFTVTTWWHLLEISCRELIYVSIKEEVEKADWHL